MRQSLLMPLTPNTLRGLVLDDKYIKSWSEQGPDRWFFRALLPTDGTIRYSILLLYGCSVALKKWKTLWFTTVLAVIQIVSCHSWSWDNLQWLFKMCQALHLIVVVFYKSLFFTNNFFPEAFNLFQLGLHWVTIVHFTVGSLHRMGLGPSWCRKFDFH